MKVLRTVAFSAFFIVLLALAACGKRSSPARPALGPSGPQVSASSQSAAQPQPQAVFTEEDYRLMAMPYEERLAYLKQRLKDLVYELHGIVIEESVSSDKAASVVIPSPGHAVCKVDPEDGYLFNEELQVDEVTAGTAWQLHFLERLSGDCDFNHAVSIADITPIAMYYNGKEEDLDWMDGPYHVDRLANDDGKIGIADITPIAINYGLRLKVEPEEEPVGYNVYCMSQSDDDDDSRKLV